MIQLARSFCLNHSMALRSDIIHYSEDNLLYMLPKHLQFYIINSNNQFSWYSQNILYTIHGYKSLSSTTDVKTILQPTSFHSGFKPMSVLILEQRHRKLYNCIFFFLTEALPLCSNKIQSIHNYIAVQ